MAINHVLTICKAHKGSQPAIQDKSLLAGVLDRNAAAGGAGGGRIDGLSGGAARKTPVKEEKINKITAIKPVATTGELVTLSKEDYQVLKSAAGRHQSLLAQHTPKKNPPKARARGTPPAGPAEHCPWCGRSHAGVDQARCWSNPNVPMAKVPENLQEKIQARRRDNRICFNVNVPEDPPAAQPAGAV
jgi:hypothetical protein